jgi:hypothetical protein
MPVGRLLISDGESAGNVEKRNHAATAEGRPDDRLGGLRTS